MDSETNQTTFDVNVYFVVPSKYENEEECSEDMWEAYNQCSEWDICPEWILEKKCLKMEPEKKDAFVIETFEGDAFQKLQSSKCMVIGPRCLLSCFLTGEPIPDSSTPIYNTAMRGLIVSASGFTVSIKNEIQKKVEYMGGSFTKQLRSSVTHLVADNVMSAKYERAVVLNIKIVLIDWVHSVWETNLRDTVPAADSVFDRYKCPPFLNLVVTSTNLNKRQKEEVKKLINDNGGEFMGILDGTKVKIVITVETKNLSDKLKYAMQNDIPCLKVDWVYDSVQAGYSLPFTDYIIKSTQACSTPEKTESNVQPLNFSTISMIPGDNHNIFVDETIASATTMSSTMCSTIVGEIVPAITKITYITVLDRLSLADAKKAGPFLDGCNIYLSGFAPIYRDKLNRILNVGSATRLDEISDNLTHVIVGDATKAKHDLKIIKSKNLFPYILKVDWLEESMKIQQPATEENFLFDGKDRIQQTPCEPPSPLSKKNLQLLQRPKIPAVPLFDEKSVAKKPDDEEDCDIVKQYLQKTTSEPDNSMREILKLPSNETNGANVTSTNNQSSTGRFNDTTKRDDSLNNDSAIPQSQESCITQKILQGLVFVISGIERDEYNQLLAQIHSLGGKIVNKNYSGIPDYGIVARYGSELKHTVGEVVTDLFIEDCIDSEKLVNVAYYHRPIVLLKNTKPLENCVLGISSYSGVERTYLSLLATALGARCQDTFARKTNLEKNTYSSTHLICPEPQGQKYNAAVKWRLPAVTADWLLQCSADMKLQDETPYLVGETMAPERNNAKLDENNPGNDMMKPPTEPTPRQRTLSNGDQEAGTSETPVINKRLNSLINRKTPQSPFHISTPETPYGQVFKENPSPRTRKGWARWIDHFPDLPIEEPPPKRRKSTPFSEVKRMAWDFVTGRLDTKEQSDTTKNREEGRGDDDEEQNAGDNENESSHIATNRRLSFSDDSPNKTPKNPEINLQIAQLEDLLQKASNTPDARQSLSAENAKSYHYEPSHPAGRCIIKESQPDSVGWEDPVKRIPPQRRSTLTEEPVKMEYDGGAAIAEDEERVTEDSRTEEMQKLKFMFSGIKDKSIAEKFIKEHGGEVSTEAAFDPSATHLICLKPSRNEKTLSSIAAGKWVLHYLYIEACINESKFMNEEEFEFGNPKSIGVIPDPVNDAEKIIRNAAHRWRLKLLKDPGGAFQDIVALLITPKEKKDQFERLIHAGGGVVVDAKPPYNSSPGGRKITHCFIQMKQVDQRIDWAMMANKGILCYPPQYLNDHLMAENPLNPRDSVLPEFQKYLTLLPK